MEESIEKTNSARYVNYIMAVISLFIVLLFVAVGHLYYKCSEQEEMLANAVNNNRKIYVYNLEEVLIKLGAPDNKQKFDASIVKLNKELIENEKKIKNIKQAKLKADFSDVYLDNLRMKRDELISDYQNSVKELDKKIKQALVKIAKEKDAPAVFLKSAIAIQTPYVVDLTKEVVDRVQTETRQGD